MNRSTALAELRTEHELREMTRCISDTTLNLGGVAFDNAQEAGAASGLFNRLRKRLFDNASLAFHRFQRTLRVKQRRVDMLIQHPTFRFEGTAASRKFVMIKSASSLNAIAAPAVACVVLLAAVSATSAQEKNVGSPWSNSTAASHQDQWKNLYNSNDSLDRIRFSRDLILISALSALGRREAQLITAVTADNGCAFSLRQARQTKEKANFNNKRQSVCWTIGEDFLESFDSRRPTTNVAK
jgi:hypothetical protein